MSAPEALTGPGNLSNSRLWNTNLSGTELEKDLKVSGA